MGSAGDCAMAFKGRIDRRGFIRTSFLVTGGVMVGCQPPPADPVPGEALEASQQSSLPAAPQRIEVSDTSRAVQRVVAAVRKKEGAGFEVRRPFPTRELDLLDPFLLLDEMGPTLYGPGEALGAPDHPHRGFETITYVLDGDLAHKDSMGHSGWVGPGGVQWMTAGSGIVHSEMPADHIIDQGGRMHGFQLWVNLPSDLKMIEPTYQEVATGGLPLFEATDGS